MLCRKACDGVCERCTADGKGCELVPDGLDDNATCPNPRACSAGRCLDAPGDPCIEGSECASGFCGDITISSGFLGVCCDTACTGPCQFCDAVDGVCRQVLLQDDPELCQPTNGMWCDKHGSCRLETGSECGNDTQCPMDYFCSTSLLRCEKKHPDGQSCTGPGVECASGFCANNICCRAPCDTCDAGGICSLDPALTTGRCLDDLQCDVLGRCALPKGSPCTNEIDCATGFCVDVPASGGKRVCSDQRCDGLCEATDLTGSCKPVLSGPDEECNSPFECAGRNRCLLQLGQGCGTGLSCASGICDDGMCCSQLCAPGFHCAGGGCEPDVAAGLTCSTPSECGTGLCENGRCCLVACGPCQFCASNGAFCDSSRSDGGTTPDCKNGNICNASAHCVFQ